MLFSPKLHGGNTTGSWSIYFDGSDIRLSAASENTNALAVDAAGRLYRSTIAAFSISGVSSADEDVFVFTPHR